MRLTRVGKLYRGRKTVPRDGKTGPRGPISKTKIPYVSQIFRSKFTRQSAGGLLDAFGAGLSVRAFRRLMDCNLRRAFVQLCRLVGWYLCSYSDRQKRGIRKLFTKNHPSSKTNPTSFRARQKIYESQVGRSVKYGLESKKKIIGNRKSKEKKKKRKKSLPSRREGKRLRVVPVPVLGCRCR